MFVTSPAHTNIHLSEQPNVRHTLPIPMVYEHVSTEPIPWEYHLLTIDTREQALPDVTQLNELGRVGWLLVGILDQGVSERSSPRSEAAMTAATLRGLDQGVSKRSSLVHYYFVRQQVK